MAQNYTRQSSFSDGDTITSSLFNNEYNQIVNAFTYSSSSDSSTGHKHDGNAGQGGNIPQIGDIDFNNKIVVDGTNNRWGVFVEVSGSAVEQIRIQDGGIVPVTDSDVDLGTSSLYFKAAYIDAITTTGNVAVGGNLTVTGTTTFNGGTITMGDAATDNVVFGANVDSHIIPDDDGTYDLGSSTQEWKDIYIDGTAYVDAINFNGTAITATAAELNILDGVTSTAAELNILDGVTSTAAELNILDGVTSTAAELNILDGVTSTAAELNILDGVTATATELNLLDGVTATTTELNLIDGVTATTAELNILDGVTATATEINLLDGVTSTTAELNILDGVTSTAAELNLLDGKAFLDEDDMSSDSATGIASQQSIKAYVDAQQDTVDTFAEVLALSNTTGGTDIAVGTGDDITFADSSKAVFGAGSEIKMYSDGTNGYIDTAQLIIANAAHTNNIAKFIEGGAVELFHNNAQKLATSSTGIQVTGNIANASGDLTLDVAGDIVLDADGGDIKFKDNGTHFGSIFTTSTPGAMYVQSLLSGQSLHFATVGGVGLTIGSNLSSTFAGAATFNSSVQTGGLVDVRTAHTSTDVTAANSNTTLRLLNSGSGNGIYNAIKFSGNQQDMYIMSFNNATQADRRLGFFVGSTAGDAATDERLSITGDGNVGIGTNSPTTDVTKFGSGASGLSVAGGQPVVAVRSTSNAQYVGYLGQVATNTYLGAIGGGDLLIQTGTSGTEKARLTSDGNLLVGTTSTSIATTSSETGTQITDGGISIAANNPVAQFNRISSDGAIVNLRKNGSTIGSLGVSSGDNLFISGIAGHAGLQFSSNQIAPMVNGVDTDATVSLGVSSSRFANLYLSGTAKVGNDVILGNQETTGTGGTARIVATGGQVYFQGGLAATSGSAAPIVFGAYGGTGERARLTSDGNLALGTSSGSGVRLNVTTPTANHVAAQIENSNTADSFGLIVKAGNDVNDYTADFRKRDNTSVMRISGDGNVGLGVVPSATGAYIQSLQIGEQANLYSHIPGVGAGSSTYLANNITNNSGPKYIKSDAGSEYVQQSGNHAWYTFPSGTAGASATATRVMSTDTSGNLLVGESADFNATSTTATGMAVTQEGRLTVSRSGTPMFVARLGSDGSLIDFWRQGAQVGSIGTANSGDLYIGNDDTTLLFAGGSDAIIPRGTAGATRDAAIDLGLSAHRFKDLHLSGQASVPTLTGVTTINTASSTGVLEIYGGATNKGGKILLSGGNNTSDGADIRFHSGASTATPLERMRLQQDGILHITSAAEAIVPTIIHSGATGQLAKLRVINRNGQGANKGGLLELGGVTNDEVTRSDVFASVAGLKTNGTSNVRTGYLQLSVSDGSTLQERARITDDGLLLVGKTSGDFGTEGSNLVAGGHFVKDGNSALYLNRLSSDGSILALYKDGTTIGSISTKSDDLAIHSSITNHTGLSFSDGAILPTNNYGTTSTNTADLGSSSRKFKALWLSGNANVEDRLLVNGATSNAQLSVKGDAALRAQNVQVATDGHIAIGFFNAAGTDVGGIGINASGASIALGGNAVANTLDDYEEGTWTPTFRDLAGNLATLSTALGSYTKIGRQVILNFNLTLSSKGSMTGAYCLMSNLPFSHPNHAYNGTGHIDKFTNFDTAVSGLSFDISSTGTLMWLMGVAAAGSGTSQYIPTSYIGGNEHFKGTCIYYTDD